MDMDIEARNTAMTKAKENAGVCVLEDDGEVPEKMRLQSCSSKMSVDSLSKISMSYRRLQSPVGL